MAGGRTGVRTRKYWRFKEYNTSDFGFLDDETMDVDMDIDSQLLREFSAMRTTDKEVLISQFQKLLGDQRITQQECDFFLDMNNW